MTNYFISDPHFGHDKIMKLCKRPFKTTQEMDAALLHNINSKVTPDDDLWIIGDFSCGGRSTDTSYLSGIFHSITARKHLIIGNHDTNEVLNLPWESVHEMTAVKDGKQEFMLCHYPMLTWENARKNTVHLFGHIHNNWAGSHNSVNMSVEHWDYTPANCADILRRAKKLPKNPIWNEVEPEQ